MEAKFRFFLSSKVMSPFTIFFVAIAVGTHVTASQKSSYSHIWKEYKQDGNKCCSTDPNKPSNGCEQTSLHANQYIQAVITPSYPHGLPSHRQCTWTIQSKPGKRVRIDFRDFYLIGPNDDGECHEQFVMILSSQQYKMGPFCGNTGLQSIVSPDNLLVIQLEVKNSQSAENYRGFRMEFTESEETPSAELRPSDWENGKDMFLVGHQMRHAIAQFSPSNQGQAQPATTSTYRTVAQNTLRPPRIRQSKPFNTIITRSPLPEQTTKRPKFYGPRVNNNQNNQRNTGHSDRRASILSTEAIAGIAVGTIVLLALLLLIILLIRRVSRSNAQSQTKNTKTDKEPKTLAAQVYAEENSMKQHDVVGTSDNFQALAMQMKPPTYASLAQNLNYRNAEYLEPNYGIQQHNVVPQLQSPETHSSPTVCQPAQVPNKEMLLYDPISGVYFEPTQLQAVEQRPVGNYYTLPYTGSQPQQFYFKKASTIRHTPKHNNKKRPKGYSVSQGKKRSHRPGK